MRRGLHSMGARGASAATPVRGRRAALLVAAPALVMAIGAGAAYGYFSSSGSGTTSDTAGTLQIVTVVAETGTPSTPLVPGGTGDVALNVTNPNSYIVYLVSVVGDGPITASGGTDCTGDNSGVTFNNQTSVSTPIPANTTSYSIDLTGAASMSASSVSGCQGATFSIPVTITVHVP